MCYVFIFTLGPDSMGTGKCFTACKSRDRLSKDFNCVQANPSSGHNNHVEKNRDKFSFLIRIMKKEGIENLILIGVILKEIGTGR